MMTLIDLEDLKKWRANRIQGGQCSFDDMQALGHFIETAEKVEVDDELVERWRTL